MWRYVDFEHATWWQVTLLHKAVWAIAITARFWFFLCRNECAGKFKGHLLLSHWHLTEKMQKGRGFTDRWMPVWVPNLTGTVCTDHQPFLQFTYLNQTQSWHFTVSPHCLIANIVILKITSCNNVTSMTLAKWARKHSISTLCGYPVGCLLTWLAVSREKGCHYSICKRIDITGKRVVEKKMPAEQNAHIVKKKQKTAIAMNGLNMIKIYLSCNSNIDGWISRDVAGVAMLRTACASLSCVR